RADTAAHADDNAEPAALLGLDRLRMAIDILDRILHQIKRQRLYQIVLRAERDHLAKFADVIGGADDDQRIFRPHLADKAGDVAFGIHAFGDIDQNDLWRAA